MTAMQHAKDEAETAKKTAEDEKAKAQADYAKQVADPDAKNAADLVAQQKTIDTLNGEFEDGEQRQRRSGEGGSGQDQ